MTRGFERARMGAAEGAIVRGVVLAGAILLFAPNCAFAHGEQALIAPASTLVILLVGGVVFAGFLKESGRLKTLLLAVLLGTHGSLWFLPMATTAVDIGTSFAILTLVPLGITTFMYVLIKRHRAAETDVGV